eukprot:2872289-Rhodomonas_salina.2
MFQVLFPCHGAVLRGVRGWLLGWLSGWNEGGKKKWWEKRCLWLLFANAGLFRGALPLSVHVLVLTLERNCLVNQLLRLMCLNQTDGTSGGFDGADSFSLQTDAYPRAGETYGVAGVSPPRYIGGWFPDTGARLNS